MFTKVFGSRRGTVFLFVSLYLRRHLEVIISASVELSHETKEEVTLIKIRPYIFDIEVLCR